jgi:DNA adenine methylase
VLLARPSEPRIETVNDADGLICNMWRAMKADPEAVAGYADYIVSECDLHARHAWLVGQKDGLQARLEGDPEYDDAKVAGWWCWGMACWIGSGFCSGNGPWHVVDGELVNTGNAGRGVKRQMVHLGNAGQGVKRKLVHLGSTGQGVQRKRVQLGGAYSPAKGAANKTGAALLEWFAALSVRLRRVRVCCGDWKRVCGPSVTYKNGLTGVFLDPPYAVGRDENLYRVDSTDVTHDVAAWCIENGDNPLLRIALCGYEGSMDMPASWECVPWKTRGGYGSQGNGRGKANAGRERIWFNKSCINPELDLFRNGGSDV